LFRFFIYIIGQRFVAIRMDPQIFLAGFLVVKLIYLGLNFRFNISVIFMTNYFFNERRCPVDNETLLVTDFVKFKIKLTQSFIVVYTGRVCIHIFIV
jgi:hypothetical protein